METFARKTAVPVANYVSSFDEGDTVFDPVESVDLGKVSKTYLKNQLDDVLNHQDHESSIDSIELETLDHKDFLVRYERVKKLAERLGLLLPYIKQDCAQDLLAAETLCVHFMEVRAEETKAAQRSSQERLQDLLVQHTVEKSEIQQGLNAIVDDAHNEEIPKAFVLKKEALTEKVKTALYAANCSITAIGGFFFVVAGANAYLSLPVAVAGVLASGTMSVVSGLCAFRAQKKNRDVYNGMIRNLKRKLASIKQVQQVGGVAFNYLQRIQDAPDWLSGLLDIMKGIVYQIAEKYQVPITILDSILSIVALIVAMVKCEDASGRVAIGYLFARAAGPTLLPLISKAIATGFEKLSKGLRETMSGKMQAQEGEEERINIIHSSVDSLCSVFGGIFGYKSKPVTRDEVQRLQLTHLAFSTVKDFGGAIKTVFSICWEAFSLFFTKITGRPIIIGDKKELIEKANEWVNEVAELRIEHQVDSEVFTDHEVAEKIEALYKKSMDIRKDMTKQNITSGHFPAFFNLVRVVDELHDITINAKRTGFGRIEPIYIHMDGDPHAGKSVFAQFLFADILKISMKRDYNQNLTFTKMFTADGEDAYWEGYHQQPFVLFEELWQYKDEELRARIAVMLNHLVNVHTFNLPMAFGGKGKTDFTSRMIVSTSNGDESTKPTFKLMQDASSYYRRLDFHFVVRNTALSNDGNRPSIDREDFDATIYRIDIVDPETREIRERNLTYNDVLCRLLALWREKETKVTKNVQKYLRSEDDYHRLVRYFGKSVADRIDDKFYKMVLTEFEADPSVRYVKKSYMKPQMEAQGLVEDMTKNLINQTEQSILFIDMDWISICNTYCMRHSIPTQLPIEIVQSGPPHLPKFEYRVLLSGGNVDIKGGYSTKKEAQQAAAKSWYVNLMIVKYQRQCDVFGVPNAKVQMRMEAQGFIETLKNGVKGLFSQPLKLESSVRLPEEDEKPDVSDDRAFIDRMLRESKLPTKKNFATEARIWLSNKFSELQRNKHIIFESAMFTLSLEGLLIGSVAFLPLLAIGYCMYRLYQTHTKVSELMEGQSYDASFKRRQGGKEPKSKVVHTAMKLKKPISKPTAQALTADPSIAQLVAKNLCDIGMYKSKKCTFFFISERFGLTTGHSFSDLLDGVTDTIWLDKYSTEPGAKPLELKNILDFECVYAEDRDLLFINFLNSKVPQHKNVFQHLPTVDEIRSVYDHSICMVSKRNNTDMLLVSPFAKRKDKYSYEVTGKGTLVAPYALEAYMPTIKGDCGSAYFSLDGRDLHKILAVNICGDNQGVCAGAIITREIILEACSAMEHAPKFAQGIEEPSIDDPDLFMDNVLTPAIQDKVPEEISFRDVEEAREFCEELILQQSDGTELPKNMFIVGKLFKKYRVRCPQNSKLMKSLIFDKVVEHTKEPANMSSDIGEDGLTPFRRSLDKFDRNNIRDEAWLQKNNKWLAGKLDECEEYLLDLMPTSTGKIFTVDEALNGHPDFRYFNKIDKDTSNGWPLTQEKLAEKFVGKGKSFVVIVVGEEPDTRYEPRPWFAQELEEEWNQMAYHIPLKTKTYQASLKDELRELGKVNKPRIFNPQNVKMQLHQRRLYGEFVNMVMENHNKLPFKMGINPHGSDWWKFYTYLRDEFKDPRVLQGDFKWFDASLLRFLMGRAFRLMNKWYERHYESLSDEDRIKFQEELEAMAKREVMAEANIGQFMAIMTFLVYVMQGNPSGEYLTTIINSIIDFFVCMCAFCWWYLNHYERDITIDEAVKLFKHADFGDDNVNVTDEPITMQDFADAIKHLFGMTYTDPGKTGIMPEFYKFEEISFLKRSFLEKGGGVVFAPLELQSIQEQINWIHKDNPLGVKTAVEINCKNALREMFYYGKAEFQKFKISVNYALKEAGCHPVTTSYDRLLSEYYAGDAFDKGFMSAQGIDDCPTFTHSEWAYMEDPPPEFVRKGQNQQPESVRPNERTWFNNSKNRMKNGKFSHYFKHIRTGHTYIAIGDCAINWKGDLHFVQSGPHPLRKVVKGYQSDVKIPDNRKRRGEYVEKIIHPLPSSDDETEDEVETVKTHTVKANTGEDIVILCRENVVYCHLCEMEKFYSRRNAEYCPDFNENKMIAQSMDDEGRAMTTDTTTEQTAVTAFSDHSSTVSEPAKHKSPLYGTTDVYPDQSVKTRLSRTYTKNVTWTSAQAMGAVILELDLPVDLIDGNANIISMLSKFQFFRSDVEIEFRVNGTTFHQGKLLVVWLPHYNPDDIGGKTSQPKYELTDIYTASCNNSCILSANANTTAKIVIPFMGGRQYLNLAHLNDTGLKSTKGFFGYLKVFVLNVLDISSAATVPDVTLTYNMRFANPEVAGLTAYSMPDPTSKETVSGKLKGYSSKMKLKKPTMQSSPDNNNSKMEAQGKDEQTKVAKSGVVSTIFEKVGTVVALLSPLPYIGGIASIASPIFLAVSAIAKFFGYDKPKNTEIVKPMINQPIDDLVYGVGADNSTVIAITPTNAVSNDYKAFCDDVDYTIIRNYAGLPSLVDVFTSATPAEGQVIAEIPVTPNYTHMTNPAVDNYQMWGTMMGAAAANFRFWRGSIKFAIYVTCSKFVSGRIRISWIPSIHHRPPDTTDGAGDYVSKIYDINGDQVIFFSVPYLQTTEWVLSLPYAIIADLDDPDNTFPTVNGVIQISVASDFSTTDVALFPPIAFNVFMAAGEDFRVACPRSLWRNITVGFYSGMLAQDINEADLYYPRRLFKNTFPPLLEPVHIIIPHGNIMGEEIESFRTLAHRYTAMLNSGNTFSSNPMIDIYDPGSEFSGGNALIVSKNWLQCMFLFSRGSKRYLYTTNRHYTDATTPSTNKGLLVARFVEYAPLLDPDDNAIDDDTILSQDGVVITDLNVKNSIQVQIPYYQNVVMDQNWWDYYEEYAHTLVPKIVWYPAVSNATVSMTMYRFQAYGDDWSAGWPKTPLPMLWTREASSTKKGKIQKPRVSGKEH